MDKTQKFPTRGRDQPLMDFFKMMYLFAVYNSLNLDKDTKRLKVKGWKKIFHVSSNQRRTGVNILTANKIDFAS